MIGTKPPKGYMLTDLGEALARVRDFDADIELLTYRIERLENRIWLLLIGLVMLAFFFGLYVWASTSVRPSGAAQAGLPGPPPARHGAPGCLYPAALGATRPWRS